MALLQLHLLLQFACLFQAIAFQPRRGSYVAQERLQHIETRPVKESVDCVDEQSPLRCAYEKRKRGCGSETMEANCAKTCLACHLKKAPAPPKDVDCKETRYGCCWDGKTIQHNYEGEGCPECEDNRIFAALCKIWERHCHNKSSVAEYEVMQKNCHRTCNNCYISKATKAPQALKTLPPAIGDVADSDDHPRRGAIYVWTKHVQPFERYE